jgi:hypothetical protein
MIGKWKASLRAWLIALVREAIRAENLEEKHLQAEVSVAATLSVSKTEPLGSNPSFRAISEPSFEQMQAEAIKEQEKYYEPRDASARRSH